MGSHLTFEQRCKLAALHQAGLTQAEIAAHIGSNQSAISRELRRNGGSGGYACRSAHEAATTRRSIANSIPHKMTPRIVALIEAKLRREKWSPQQISCWLAQTHWSCPDKLDTQLGCWGYCRSNYVRSAFSGSVDSMAFCCLSKFLSVGLGR